MPENSTGTIARLLSEPDHVDAVLCKLLAPNDDSGRHGVVVPVDAYSMFPGFEGFDAFAGTNYTTELSTVWPGGLWPGVRSSRWKHYCRYPERRLTRLDASLNGAPPGTALLVARRNDQDCLYELRLVLPSDPLYVELLNETGLTPSPPASFTDLDWKPGKSPVSSEFIRDLLSKFEANVADGWHQTVTVGSPGVGETFEALFGVARNNSPGPDWKDIEFKCSNEGKTSTGRPKGLFLMEPTWVGGARSLSERLHYYGYEDDSGLPSWFQAVGVKMNSRGLSLLPDTRGKRLALLLDGTEIAWWDVGRIEAKVKKKLAHTVFVWARSRGEGAGEEFKYVGLRYCSEPTGKRLLECIERGNGWVELRMGLDSRGKPKNWGSQFRVTDSALDEVFSRIQILKDPKSR